MSAKKLMQARAVLRPDLVGERLTGHIPIDIGNHGEAALVVWKMEDDQRSPDCEEMARRLVACWNACEGVETDLIEAAGDGLLAKALKQVGQKHEALRNAEAQRDELLVALENIIDGTPIGEFNRNDDGLSDDCPRDFTVRIAAAHVAIAKVKGGAA